MLVRENVMEFVRLSDPNDTTGAEITPSTLSTNNGEKFTKERRLDLYNQARKLVLRELMKLFGRDSDHVLGFLIPDASLSWTYFTTYSTAVKPQGWLTVANDETSIRVGNVPVRLRKEPGKLLAGNNPELYQNAAKLFAFVRATDFVHYGNTNPATNSFIPTATYKIDYIGIVDHILSDLALASTKEEAFLDVDMPLVIQTVLTLARNENNAALAMKEIRDVLKKP